jgi:uncharacterized protein (TIGR03382 family)
MYTFKSGVTQFGTIEITSAGPSVVATATLNPPVMQDFGSIRIGQTGTAMSLVISNTGDAGSILQIDAAPVLFSGDTGEWAAAGGDTFPQSLMMGQSTTVSYQFKPTNTTTGTRTTSLKWTDNSGGAVMATQSQTLVGLATDAQVLVTGVDFGTVDIGSNATANVQVSNSVATNTGPLHVTGATLTGANGWITFSNGAGCTGGTSCTLNLNLTTTTPQNIQLKCAPPGGSSGTTTAVVTFASDTRAGTGTDHANVLCTAGTHIYQLSETSFSFGAQAYNTSSAAHTVTVTNAGTGHITITSINSSNTSDFTQTACTGCGTSLAPGGTASVNVTFKPQHVQTGLTDNVTVTTTATVMGGATDVLTGDGTGALLALTSSATPTIDGVETETSAPITITYTNQGTSTVTITNPTLTNMPIFQLSGGATTVGVGNSVSWMVTCTPPDESSQSAMFSLSSNSVVAAASVSITCTSKFGKLIANANPVVFPDTSVGNTSTATFQLKNTGGVQLTNIALMATTGPFTVQTTAPTSLNGGSSSSNLTVQFAPTDTNTAGNATYTAMWNADGTNHPVTLVVTFNGTALTNDCDFQPSAITIPTYAYDGTSAAQTFKIHNGGTGPCTFPLPGYTPGTGAEAGDVSVSYTGHNVGDSVTLAAGADQNGSLTGQPTAPHMRIGTIGGTLTFMTTSPASSDPHTLTITGTTAGGQVAVTPGNTVNLGSVDVQGGTGSQVFTIQNPSAAAVSVAITSFNVTAGASFHVENDLPATLAPNASGSFTVTYDPSVAGPDETATITVGMGGAEDGSMMPLPSEMFTVTGHPIDRDIQVSTDPADGKVTSFPYPGDLAPVVSVPVHNAGEADLTVSAVMLNADSSWTLAEQGMQTIAGGPNNTGATFTFHFTYAPTALSDTPDVATVTIDNNTTGMTMVMETLTGTAIDRMVQFGPADPTMPIPLGFTPVGVPIDAAGALGVINKDPDHPFKIAKIVFSDPAFALDSTPDGIQVDAADPASFGVTFTPKLAQAYTVTADLYLDADPDKERTVTFTGTGVEVSGKGGGGCSTSGGGTGGLVLLGASLFAARRRRRRVAAVVAAAAGIVVAAPAAHADPSTGDISLAIFDPLPSTAGNGFQTQTADVGPNGAWSVGVTSSYATDLIKLTPSMGVATQPLTTSSMLVIGGAYAFLDRFEVGAHIPLYHQAGDDAVAPTDGVALDAAKSSALGTLELDGKATLVRAAGFIGGIGVVAALPTATSNSFVGTDDFAFRAMLLGNYTLPVAQQRISLAVNVGGVLRPKTEQYLHILEKKSGLAWSAGGSVRVLDSLWITGEIFGEMIPGGAFETTTADMMLSDKTKTLQQVEALGGIQYRPDHRVTIALAAGRGVSSDPGTPGFRGILAVSFVPGAALIAPIPHPLPPPDGDRDGDGIPDSIDKCPDQPEDKDGFQDDDGCPDPDNDGDGIPDALDKCPLDPEDKDGFQDDDGCPDPDNDGDGIPDIRDKCPNEPEDKDGFEDLDGCPDPDNDGDGIPDAQDKCPNEPETINGFQDDDGCPDKGDSTIILSPDRIETLDPISFKGTAITKPSFSVLGQVAATLRAHGEILRLRVTVHVQPTADPSKDQALSDKRAQAIKDWLVQWGIAAGRIEARGFGGTKPLISPDQKNAAKINDRIELIILERK